MADIQALIQLAVSLGAGHRDYKKVVHQIASEPERAIPVILSVISGPFLDGTHPRDKRQSIESLLGDVACADAGPVIEAICSGEYSGGDLSVLVGALRRPKQPDVLDFWFPSPATKLWVCVRQPYVISFGVALERRLHP